MKTPKDLINKLNQNLLQPSEQEQPMSNGKPSKRVMYRLWEVMQEAYGHQWNSQYGEQPTETWERFLTGITPDQIKDGLERLAYRQETWPPNAQEFRALCEGLALNKDGHDISHHHRSAAYIDIRDPKHPDYRPVGIEDLTAKEKRKTQGAEKMKAIQELMK